MTDVAVDMGAVELWVGNARHAARWFAAALGFSVVETARPSSGDRVSYVLQQGGITMIVTGATRRGSPVAEFVARHGDGVRDVSLTVEGRAPGVITAFGDTVHTLVEPPASPSPPGPDGVGLRAVDHVAVSVEPGDRERIAARYQDELGFVRIGTPMERVDVGGSAFAMSSVRARSGDATLVFAEPAAGPSQIADFLAEYGGPGVHHLAFATDDVLATATRLRDRGVRTLPVPPAYYPHARARLGDVDLPWERLEALGILVDRDEDGLLLQAFTEPIGDRPTLYFEIIQRCGALGFGADNVRALYHAVVMQQSVV